MTDAGSIIQGLRAPPGEFRTIQSGDIAIIYERFDSMKAITIDVAGRIHNRYGLFDMKDWIGKPYGSKFASNTGDGFVYVLMPTPELWTLVVRHRTQILYLADIAMVCSQLDLRPGAVVLESGTGSGSLTTSLSRAVAPTGRVFTFEFHQQRAEMAREEFAKNGIDHLVAVDHRNIELDGFPESLHGKADSVFLDLPGPWNAVASAAECLRPDGVFCGFSPCVEQVQRTCNALNNNGFKDIRTIEILLRELEVSAEKTAVPMPLLLQQQRVALTEPASSQIRNKKARIEANEAKKSRGKKGSELRANIESELRRRVVTRPVTQGKGHTGFLTFARRVSDV